MDDERLDLSPLEADPARWRAVMDSTRLRVDAVLAARRQGALAVIAAWRRPLLAAAAALVALLLPVEAALEAREARQEPVRALVGLSTGWASGEGSPTGADLLRAIHAGGAR